MLATLLGPANAERTTGVIKNVNEFSEFLTQIPGEWDQDIKPMLMNANKMVAELRSDYEGWAKRITTALARVDDASNKLDLAMDQVTLALPLWMRCQPGVDFRVFKLHAVQRRLSVWMPCPSLDLRPVQRADCILETPARFWPTGPWLGSMGARC